MTTAEENMCQGTALSMIKSFSEDQLGTIWKYGGLFREILDEFKEDGEEPSPEKILWIASEKLHCDIRQL